MDFIYKNGKSYKDIERFTPSYKTRKSTLSVNSTLRVYDFDVKKSKIDILKHDNKIEDLNICANKIETSLELLEAYVAIQRERSNIVVYKKLILEHQRRLEMKTRLYNQGLLSAAKVIDDKAELLTAVHNLNTADNLMEFNIDVIQIRTGYEINSNVRLAPLRHHYDILDKNKELNNISTKITSAKINKYKKEINALKKISYPTFDLYFNNDFYNEDSEGSPKYSSKRDYSVGFLMQWSLNNIFRNKSEKRSKLLEIKKEEILYEQTKQKLNRELNYRFIGIKNYKVFKKVNDEIIHTLQDNIEKNTRLYDEGLEHKYTISDSKIKMYTEELKDIKRKFQHVSFKKYISIVLEKDNICTLL